MKRITNDHHVPYFVKTDFRIESSNELNKLEKQVEEDLLNELRQNCYREKSYRKTGLLNLYLKKMYNLFVFLTKGDTAMWRAKNYGDERLFKKASEIETPSCNRINSIFGGG